MSVHPVMHLRTEATYDEGFGTALACSSSSDLWVAATTNTASIWRGDRLAHHVRITGYLDGRPVFSADEQSVRIGLAVVDVARGETLPATGDRRWLTSTLDDASLDPDNFAAAMVVHIPGSTRAVVLSKYLLSRGRSTTASAEAARSQLLLVDLHSDELVAVLLGDAGGHRGVIDASGELIAAAHDGEITTWSPANGDRLATWTIGDEVDSLAVHPGADEVAALDRGGHATIWTSTGTELRRWTAHDGAGAALAWAPSGHWIATASRAGHVGVWDTRSTEPDLLGERNWPSVGGLAAASDTELIVAGDVVDQGLTRVALELGEGG